MHIINDISNTLYVQIYSEQNKPGLVKLYSSHQTNKLERMTLLVTDVEGEFYKYTFQRGENKKLLGQQRLVKLRHKNA